MDPAQTTRLIAAAGGDTAFGRLLGIDEKAGFQQRVNNWKRRGLPNKVVVEHYEKLQELARQAEAMRRGSGGQGRGVPHGR